jgi:hypothetical protein
MALRDADIQAYSLLGTGMLTAAFCVLLVWGKAREVEAGPVIQDRQIIEASIAYRKEKAPKQPQKQTRQPEETKIEGVSRDADKKVEGCKSDKDCGPEERCQSARCVPKKKPADQQEDDPFKGFRRPTSDDNAPVGKPVTQPGDFNANERGFAPVSKGDPFFGRLNGDLNYNPPEIAKGSSTPIGCIHLEPDGTIPKITFEKPNGQKGDDDLQVAAETALRELQKLRNANPETVPTHLLQHTTKWLCFRFTVKSD